MSNGTRRRWDDLDDKRAAIIAVIKYVIAQPPEVGQRCVSEDAYVRQLFEDREIGNVDVPDDVKTLFMPEGEKAKEIRGSVVIELPPRPIDVPDNHLLKFVLCCYNVWAERTNL